jgi:hypothetical protein
MATAAAKNPTTKDLASEFVVGGIAAYEPYVQRVDTRDRVELRLTRRAIDQLRLDPELESDISVLADTVFADGIEIIPAINDETDAEYQEASDIADFCNKATQTRRPLEMVLKEMFKAAFYNGVKVGEIVLQISERQRIDGKLVLDRINPKPAPRLRSSPTNFSTSSVSSVPNSPCRSDRCSVGSFLSDEIIPREKFLVLAFELEDNDPRGLAGPGRLRTYCDKQLTAASGKNGGVPPRSRRSSALHRRTQSRSPSCEMPTESRSIENGVQKTISAQKGLMMALEGFANNSAITVP